MAEEIDKITIQVEAATKTGELGIEINSTTLKSYLNTKFKPLIEIGVVPDFSSTKAENDLMDELADYGLKTLEDLDKIVPKNFEKTFLDMGILDYSNFLGLTRELMMIHDAEKYFRDSWKQHYGGLDRMSMALLEKYNIPYRDLANKYDLVLPT